MNKFVVFGASGDLAKKKIMPALANICTTDVKVYGYGRMDLEQSYGEELRKVYDYSGCIQKDFPERVKYIKGFYDNLAPLEELIDENTVVYLSLPPLVYPEVLAGLSSTKIGMIAIEKPFGSDEKSFTDLLKFKNDKTYFIDHYLLKPLMLALNSIYFESTDLFGFLCKDNICSVECLFLESVLAEGRKYFDRNGLIKDVMQNHLTEVLVSILSERGNVDPIGDRINMIKKLNIDDTNCIFGQYELYTQELGEASDTETFAAFKCHLADDLWENVPFFMIGGKGMSRKATEVSFKIKTDQFGQISKLLHDSEKQKQFESFQMQFGSLADISINLIFNIAPDSEIYFRIQTLSTSNKVILYNSEDIQRMAKKKIGGMRDYELIFEKMIKNQYFPSVSFKEAHELWKIFGNILRMAKPLVYYKVGAVFPKEAAEFLRREGGSAL